MAGIGKAGGAGNILNFHIRFGKKQLPGTADAVHGNVFIDRTAKKTLEQTGKILRGYKDTLTEFGSGDVLLIPGFNFFYYGNNISLVKRVILNFRRSGAVHKIHEKIIAVRGERFHIRGWFVVFSKGIRNQFPDI